MSINHNDILVKWCTGTKREQKEVFTLLSKGLTPKAAAFMYKNSGRGRDDLIREVASDSLVKLLEHLCTSVIGSIESYYLTIVRRDWVIALKRGSLSEYPNHLKSTISPEDRIELVEVLSKMKFLKAPYQAPILIRAMGYDYMDIQEDYDSIKNELTTILKKYGLNPNEFQLEGDIQRISQGRQRLKALYNRK
jgi:DNA-directed RNA polymerase specialized sigma24 family protein